MNIYDLIALYLEDKQHLTTESDSYNVVDGNIYTWNFANIPMPTAEDLAACEASVLAKQAKESKLAQIAELEAQITSRRLRECMLGVAESIAFIQYIEQQIKQIRDSLV